MKKCELAGACALTAFFGACAENGEPDNYVASIAYAAKTTGILVSDLFWHYQGLHLFSFGAYASTYVLASGTMEAALEDAAALLHAGHFHDLEDLDAALEDFTYTESGWLLSHEWWVQDVDLPAFAALVCERHARDLT